MDYENSAKERSLKSQRLIIKLKLLIWKVWIHRKRYWLFTIFEILLPIFFNVLNIYSDNNYNTVIKENTYFNKINEKELLSTFCLKATGNDVDSDACNIGPDHMLFWGPDNIFTNDILTHFSNHINFSNLTYVNSTNQMDSLVENDYLNKKTYGIFFYLDNTTNGVVPNDFNYNLRLQDKWFTQYTIPIVPEKGPRMSRKTDRFKKSNYTTDGFLIMQILLDRSFIDILYKNKNPYNVQPDYEYKLQMYLYPPHVYSRPGFIEGQRMVFLGYVLIFSFILMMPILNANIVYEKQTGIREFMSLMGMERWMIWLGWFLFSFITAFAVSIIIAVILTTKFGDFEPYFAYSSPSLIWFLLFLYSLATIFYCLAISSIFNRSSIAIIIGMSIWLILYVNSLPKSNNDAYNTDNPLILDLFKCLHPCIAIFLAFKACIMFDLRGFGIRWGNLWVKSSRTQHLTIGMIILMLLFDCFMFLVITWYIDEVKPGTYGVPKPWYFIFTKTYWGRNDSLQENFAQSDDNRNRKFFEKEPQGLNVGIKISGLRKVFKSDLIKKVNVLAVDNMYLNCYEGQCTVLLGHNGAGKTTTMSILTGLYAPSGGSVKIQGWDIQTNLKEARAHIGYCPQNNNFLRNFSVWEHLLFFAQLKGLSYEEAESEAETILKKFQLYDQRHKYGQHLSGGMKRILCLAIAIIGKAKVIILDEPTTGLDPEVRERVWDIIKKERSNRTFLLTTHHMEEAEVLGDRVAIMTNGKVVSCGSSLFLKYTFGDGYTLSVTTVNGADVNLIMDILRANISQSSLRSKVNDTFEFQIPPETEKFAVMFHQLMEKKTQLRILHLGFSLISLDQIFLRFGEEVEDKQKKSKTFMDGLSRDDLKYYTENKLVGWQLFWSRIKALFDKRFIYIKRNWVLMIVQVVIPLLITIYAIHEDRRIYRSILSFPLDPPLKLNLEMFQGQTYSFVSNNSSLKGLANSYTRLFHGSNVITKSQNLTEDLIVASLEDLLCYRENHITSAAFEESTNGTIQALMMYQSIPYHSSAIGINLISNAILLYMFPYCNHTITTYNAPLSSKEPIPLHNMSSPSEQNRFNYYIDMVIALSCLTSFFITFPLNEKFSNAKQIQVMTGTSKMLLWTTNFLWDIVIYLFCVLPIFGCIIGLDPEEFKQEGAPEALMLLLFLYGISSILMAYVFSLIFNDPGSGFIMLLFVNFLAGTAVSVLGFFLKVIDGSPATHNFIKYVASLFPIYNAIQSFYSIQQVSYDNRLCEIVEQTVLDLLCRQSGGVPMTMIPCCSFCNTSEIGCFKKKGYYDWEEPSMGLQIFYFCFDSLLFLTILILIELRFLDYLQKMRSSFSKLIKKPKEKKAKLEMDSDVKREQQEVYALMNKASGSSALVVQDLTKVFVKDDFTAVDHISFHMLKGECFGLLGVNGAGKTTTFRMLTGDLPRTSGDARIGDHSLSHGKKKFIEDIGYCPQHDGMIKELTGEEMLSLMAGLRGVPENMKKQLIDRLVQLVDLNVSIQRPCGTYSGGNKRKLNVAMALVGQPSLVLLDEPTAGVDPVSRRNVWEALREVKSNGQSVILSSHSLDECEALCDKLVIMVKGSLQCVGSIRHLRTKFGRGFTLQVKLNSVIENMEEKNYLGFVMRLKSTILRSFEKSTLSDEHRGMLVFLVPSSYSWPDLFTQMENLKRRSEFQSLIEDYTVMDSNLEQVFLSFARKAKLDDDITTRKNALK